MAYGGSIAGLANNELAETQQRMQFSRQVGDRQAQLTAQQRRDAEILLEHMIQKQRDAQQQRNVDRSFDSRGKEVEQARTDRAREFDATQRYNYDALRETQETRRMGKVAEDFNRSDAAAQREEAMLYKSIENDAETGPWGNSAEFRASVPPSMFKYEQVLLPRSQQVRKIGESQFAQDEMATTWLNKLAAAKLAGKGFTKEAGEKKLERSWLPDGDFWRPGTPNADFARDKQLNAAEVENYTARTGTLSPDVYSRLQPGANGDWTVKPLPWMSRLPGRGSGDSMPQRPVGVEALPPSPPVDSRGAFTVPTATTQLPAVGEVRRGYRYIGGDPSAPQSWQRIQ